MAAAAEEMFTTAAASEARSAGRTALVRRIAANRLSSKLSCHASSGIVAVPSRNARTARVVHQDVEAAERRERLCRDGLHAFARGDIAGYEGCPGGHGVVRCTRSDDDLGAGIEQALRDGGADAARASGDQGTAAAEFLREIGLVGHGMFLR
jgi:hypothetical protein